jgi:hypothetical protein
LADRELAAAEVEEEDYHPGDGLCLCGQQSGVKPAGQSQNTPEIT